MNEQQKWIDIWKRVRKGRMPGEDLLDHLRKVSVVPPESHGRFGKPFTMMIDDPQSPTRCVAKFRLECSKEMQFDLVREACRICCQLNLDDVMTMDELDGETKQDGYAKWFDRISATLFDPEFYQTLLPKHHHGWASLVWRCVSAYTPQAAGVREVPPVVRERIAKMGVLFVEHLRAHMSYMAVHALLHHGLVTKEVVQFVCAHLLTSTNVLDLVAAQRLVLAGYTLDILPGVAIRRVHATEGKMRKNWVQIIALLRIEYEDVVVYRDDVQGFLCVLEDGSHLEVLKHRFRIVPKRKRDDAWDPSPADYFRRLVPLPGKRIRRIKDDLYGSDSLHDHEAKEVAYIAAVNAELPEED